MAHIGFLSEDQVERSLWDIEDGELLTVLKRRRAELRAQQKETAKQTSPQTGGA